MESGYIAAVVRFDKLCKGSKEWRAPVELAGLTRSWLAALREMFGPRARGTVAKDVALLAINLGTQRTIVLTYRESQRIWGPVLDGRVGAVLKQTGNLL